MHDEPHAQTAFQRGLARARHLLPMQRPIGEFVHHNTLHAYQHLPFHDAIAAAARDHGAEVYWPEARFREAMALGAFGVLDVDRAHVALRGDEAVGTVGPLRRRDLERLALVHDLGREAIDVVEAQGGELLRHVRAVLADVTLRRGPLPRTHREAAVAAGEADPAAALDALFVPFLGALLDDGMARWAMPMRARGLRDAFLVYASGVPAFVAPCAAGAAARLARGTAESVATRALDELRVPEHLRDEYVLATVLELPGFAGMVSVLETGPGARLPEGALEQYVAARLACHAELVRLRGGVSAAFEPAVHPPHPDVTERARDLRAGRLVAALQRLGFTVHDVLTAGDAFVREADAVLESLDGPTRRRIYQTAMEAAHREALGAAILDRRGRLEPTPAVPCRLAVVFCIDDREEGIRRHLESQHPGYVTYGAAGFFGVAMHYVGFDDPRSQALCPVVVTPAHEVVERPVESSDRSARLRRALVRARAGLELALADASRGGLRGLLVTPLLGALAVFPLAARILFPRAADRFARRVGAALLPSVETELVVDRADDAADGVGFSLDERVDRVRGLLENIGLLDAFPPVVAVLGHAASTVNNPHHSAYDCGACGGRNGGPNARAFARMANDPAVRAQLASTGIVIPEETVFVGGVHDTTTDGITLFDPPTGAAATRAALDELKAALDLARGRSALERCRRFEHAPTSLRPDVALRHVEERAVDLSQARPELGHATNAACVVGRRALTRGLFLDRRSFLVSYDPTTDADGRVLARILAAVVPVGAGINLEYYFSSVDPDRFGCGTKLPHNLTGLVGVAEGTSGDLRTGLPREMTEVHEPVRLLCVLDARVAHVAQVLERNPEVREFVVNEWIRVLVIDPDTGEAFSFEDGRLRPYEPRAERSVPVVSSAADWYRGHRHSLPPARIDASMAPSTGNPSASPEAVNRRPRPNAS